MAYATSNNNQLNLHPPEISKDISKGHLKNYIYCLPSVLSGMNFGDSEEISVIKIKLKVAHRKFTFKGNPLLLNFSELEQDYDLIDMTVDSEEFSTIRFRQILLLNNSVIDSWDHSLSLDFNADFTKAISKFKNGDFK